MENECLPKFWKNVDFNNDEKIPNSPEKIIIAKPYSILTVTPLFSIGKVIQKKQARIMAISSRDATYLLIFILAILE
jgi:hypothetical protein